MKKFKFKPNLPIDDIDISKFNVRKTNVTENLDELANSIKEIGLQQPVVVFEKPDKRFELIIGQRRYLACKKIGLRTIPALIVSIKNDTEAAVISFSENIHRLELDYRDKMTIASELINKLGNEKKVADYLGVVPQTVTNWLGYAGVSDKIKEMVDKKELSATTALRISQNIPDEKKAIRIAKKIKETPSGQKRRLIIDVARENPDKSISQISKIVNQKKFTRLTIDLTEKVGLALNQASKDYGKEREEVAIDALEEWLKGRGFLK